MELHGIHHVTAVSAQIGRNAHFYTNVLGLRLVKRSVNQDDTSAYHLFYADKVGSPGTDMTFFDWPHVPPDQRGTDSIAATAFRVNGREALQFWQERLTEQGARTGDIEQFDGRDLLRFEDPEGQRLLLVDDGGAPFEGVYWDEGGVPEAYALRGFYAIVLSTPRLDRVEPILRQLLNFEEARRAPFKDGREVVIYEMDEGGPGRQVWMLEEPNRPMARMGAGGVHHVAYRLRDDEEQQAWQSRIRSAGLPVSGIIDRFYFKSIYFRISNGILFEAATDGPGFATDEKLENLGESLALPPFLEPHREQIEAGLKPIEVGAG